MMISDMREMKGAGTMMTDDTMTATQWFVS